MALRDNPRVGRMRSVSIRVVAVLALLALTACHIRAPVQNFHDEAIPEHARTLPLEEIGRQIKAAGSSLEWAWSEEQPGKLIGTQGGAARNAKVEIDYSQTSYSITLLSSKNLHQGDDGQVAGRYNIWARNLKAAIDRQFALVATKI
jgi:hypothetical protein